MRELHAERSWLLGVQGAVPAPKRPGTDSVCEAHLAALGSIQAAGWRGACCGL